MTLLLLFTGTSTIASSSGFDFFASNAPRPEYAYLGLERENHAGGAGDELAKYRVASKDVTGKSGERIGDYLIVANGHVFLEAGGSWTQLTDSVTKMDSGSSYIGSTILGGKLYFTDGQNYRVYDPPSESVSVWEADKAGTLPDSCQLLTTYAGRIVLANRGEWHMSAINAPGNWDYNPPVVTPAQAVAGVAAEAFQMTGLINSVLAYQDDYLFFGCDSSLWRLTGNPWKGGEIDQVSESIGVAFGDTMVVAPNGALYFFSTVGGVYRMAGPMGQPQCITDTVDGQDVSIQERLSEINLSTYRMVLSWDYRRRGLRVVQVPYDTGSTATLKSWFWEEKSNAWWEDEPGNSEVQPFSVAVLDGDDPADRVTVIGCKDGYVRKVSDTAVDDDGYAINSRVTLGPVAAGGDAELLLRRIRAVMGASLAGVTWQVYSSETPGDIGDLRASGTFGPGLSLRLPVSVRGPYLSIRLQNLQVNESWALEELRADLVPMGSRRVV